MSLPAWILSFLSAISLASILIKRPWTTVLARRHAPPEVWSTDLFLETNLVITGAWCLFFAGAAILAAIAPLWVSLVSAAIFVLLGRLSPRFGNWYSSRRLRAMGLRGSDEHPRRREGVQPKH